MMGEKNTKELLDRYFETMPETTVVKIRRQVDRPELYEFEQEKGKPLVEFDAMELVELLKTFNNANYKDRQYKMSYRSYDTVLSILRGFFDWYIHNEEVIINPCNDKRIKGNAGMQLLADDREVFTSETMEKIIQDVRDGDDERIADYHEAIIRLFYEGFPEASDIVKLKTSEVNEKKKTAIVRGREIKLSNRLSKLLKKVHEMEDYPAYRGTFVMVAFEDSYFKYPTRPKNAEETRSVEFYTNFISRVFNKEIKQKLNLNINGRTLYLCGFYDYMVESVGREHANEIIESLRDSEATRELMTLAAEYGIAEKNSTTLKKVMLPFVAK